MIKKNLFVRFFFSLLPFILVAVVTIFILLDLFYCTIDIIRRMTNDHQEDNNNEEQR